MVLGVRCIPPPASLVDLYDSVTAGRWPWGTCDLSPDLIHANLLPGLSPDSPVCTTFLSSSQGYLVSVAEEWNVGWKLIICDPLTVLQIEREGWFHPDRLVNGLVKKGVPFQILNPRKVETPEPHDRPGPTVNPTRARGRQQHVAYSTYRQELRQFFIDFPHAYVTALSAGGILWRIATDVLPQPDWTQIIRPFHSDRCQSLTVNGREYWTPRLTELENDVVVGVHNGCDRKFTNSDSAETTDPHPPAFEASPEEGSWWPKPQIWSGSGLDFGAWAPLSEQWYTERATELESGVARSVEARAWRLKVKYREEEARKFLFCARDLTSKFLCDSRL